LGVHGEALRRFDQRSAGVRFEILVTLC
jgi:hypothetical protein